MSSRGTTGNTQVQSPLNATTATGVFPGLIILLSIWRDISKNPKGQSCHEIGRCLKEMPWGRGLDFRRGPIASQKKVLTYKPLCTHTHTDTHIHTRCHAQTPPTHTLSCTQLYLKYIRLFFMPCPSQMVEDKEEGNQVNSARQTGCSLQHYWNYFPLLPMEIKENGCDVSAGGRQ